MKFWVYIMVRVMDFKLRWNFMKKVKKIITQCIILYSFEMQFNPGWQGGSRQKYVYESFVFGQMGYLDLNYK